MRCTIAADFIKIYLSNFKKWRSLSLSLFLENTLAKEKTLLSVRVDYCVVCIFIYLFLHIALFKMLHTTIRFDLHATIEDLKIYQQSWRQNSHALWNCQQYWSNCSVLLVLFKRFPNNGQKWQIFASKLCYF